MKNNQKSLEVNCIVCEMDLRDPGGIICPIDSEYTFFSGPTVTHRTFSKLAPFICDKTCFTKYNIIQ